MHRHLSLSLALLASLALTVSASACHHFQTETPTQFVELEERAPGFAYQATSPDGVVLAVRELPNEPKGTLAFWSEAVENQLRFARGYALLEKLPFESTKGASGALLRFGFDQDHGAQRYTVAVLVSGDRILVLEAGGPEALMDAQAEPVAAWLHSVEFDN